MKERTFNSLMPVYNEKWAANVLGMQINPKRGPDLIDNEKAIEIKFKMLYSNGKYAHKCWRVLGHQLEYNQEFPEIYWGLGFYVLNKKVKDVKRKDLDNIEGLVNSRKIYILNWDWIKQFPLYHHNGKTNFSEWNHYMLFPKFGLIPNIIAEQDVQGGKIFFTEGVNPKRFNTNENFSHQNTYKDVPF